MTPQWASQVKKKLIAIPPRYWITWLWAVSIACPLAALDGVHRWMRNQDQDRRVLLLPAQTLNDQQRRDTLGQLRRLPQIESGRWLSPSNLVNETTSVLALDSARTMFSDEEAWLPWVLELDLLDPMRHRPQIVAMLDELKSDPEWRLVLWDDQRIQRKSVLLGRIDRIVWVFALIIGMLGAAALRTHRTEPIAFRIEAPVNTAAAFGLAGLVGVVAAANGLNVDLRMWSLAALICFALAGLAAPMINKRWFILSPPKTDGGEEETHGRESHHRD